MAFDPCDSKTWHVRLTTAEVLALARFSRGTLTSRIKAGLMPPPIDSGGGGKLYDRDAVLLGLKIIADPDAPKKLMPRLQQLFNRAQPTPEEIHILRGIAKAMADAKTLPRPRDAASR